jgi:homogentisate 1,2-dioxygenase
MRQWIRYPKTAGEHSRQAHCDLPDGTYEREMGKEGFFGPACHFHHRHPPTGWESFDGPLRPHAFDLNRIEAASHTPFKAHPLLHNADMRLRWWRCGEAMPGLARNADGDELLFIHEGEGSLFCDWGHMTYRDGDYILLPRGAMWRIEPKQPTLMLLLEATGNSFGLPEKGIVGPHAIFDPAVLETPQMDEAFVAQRDGPQGSARWEVWVKRRGQMTTIAYPHNPLDALGWHGELVACKLNWRDIRPLMSHRYHLPPSVHTTFVARGFVVCTFVPRPIESDPGALKLPFYHSNDDFDEFIFYHRGSFFSRDNIRPGMTTLHPNGFTHGPHPKAFATAARAERKETDEVAVMIDTRSPLDIDESARAVEVMEYVDSWKTR